MVSQRLFLRATWQLSTLSRRRREVVGGSAKFVGGLSLTTICTTVVDSSFKPG